MNIETLSKIHKFLYDMPELTKEERINIMVNICDMLLEEKR